MSEKQNIIEVADAPTDRFQESRPALIHLDGLTKVFRGKGMETHALNGVALTIREGEYVAVEGPSGCGKSTLLSILGLLDTPTSGRYRLDGEAVENAPAGYRSVLRNRKVGYIFQNFNLIGDLNVFKNVELPLIYRGVSVSERQHLVMDALERVGMTDRLHHLPSQLSGGQQQRTAVARALVTKPVILLADEPTGNLDSRHGEAIMELMDRLHANGTTICLVSHDPRYVRYAARRVVMLDGRIVDDTVVSA